MAEFNQKKFIIQTLRRSFYKTPQYSNALELAKRRVKIGNRWRVQFQCAMCGEWKFAKEKVVDHLDCVVHIERGFVSWDEYIDRFYNGELQVLCVDCHRLKTSREATERANARKELGDGE